MLFVSFLVSSSSGKSLSPSGDAVHASHLIRRRNGQLPLERSTECIHSFDYRLGGWMGKSGCLPFSLVRTSILIVMIFNSVWPGDAIGDTDLDQQWLGQWLVAWGHLAITWTNVDLWWVRSCGIYLTAIPMELLEIFILDLTLKNNVLQMHLPGVNGLKSQ